MEHTLLPVVQSFFTAEVVKQLAKETQDSEAGIELALHRTVPLVIQTLLGRLDGPEGPEVIWKLSREAYGASVLEDIANILPNGWHERSEALMRALLGDGYQLTTLRLATTAQIGSATVGRLLSMAAAATLGVAGEYAQEHQLTENGLAQWLRQEQEVVRRALLTSSPPPVAAGIYAGTAYSGELAPPAVSSTPSAVTNSNTGMWSVVGGGHTYTPPAAPAIPAAPTVRWQWGLLLLVAVALGYVFGQNWLGFGISREPATAEATALATPTPPVRTASNNTPEGRYDEASGNYIYDTGQPLILRLADGTTQKVGANSTENRLYTFLADPAMQVDSINRTKGWINFDRVYFEPGATVLTDESFLQLRNVASILKTFPASVVKLGGYTDSTGNALKNFQLSEDRAKTAMLALANMGIDMNRIQAKGYGGKYFITPNTTPEGRALNRRISIRVLKK